MKKIAFIITVYKKENLEFFKQAINSILNQDYGFEHINIYLGIDGKLPDNINKYIENNKFYFYKIFKNKKNRGLAYTLNRLIETLEDEEYIFRMDSDDICRIDRVSKQLEVLKKDDELLVLGSDLIEIDEKGRELRKKIMPKTMDEIINYSIVRSPMNHPTVVMKREYFNIVGVYNELYMKAQDYEFWSRGLKKGIKFSNVNEPLLYFRVSNDFVHKRSSISNYLNEYRVSISLMKYFKKYGKLLKIILKLFIRISPSFINKYVYKKLRD